MRGLPWATVRILWGRCRGLASTGDRSLGDQLVYMLDQVRTTACSKNGHITGGKGEVRICVRMNISYYQAVSK